MKKINVLLLLTLIMLLITSCQSNETPSGDNPPVDEHIYYNVEFDSQGGSSVESQRVMENNPVVRPENPIYDNHSFIGWYKTPTANEDTLWHFETDRVESNLILYAGWLENTTIEEATQSLTYARTATGYEVTGVGDEERVIIPETYDNQNVTSIGEAAFARKQITYVSIPDSVTSIGLNAFNNASSLKEVNIGTNSALTTIGNNAFSGNSALESIYLPATLESLGNSVFNNASSLNTIVVASENPYYYSTGNNLIETATQTLIRGSNLSVIPEGVKIIGQAAFRRSTNEEIAIPSTVETIENYVFDDCATLKAIIVSETNNNYSSLNGVLYNKTQTTLLVVPEACNSIVVIPNTITEIPSFTFDGITTIPTIYIPTSVTNIRSFAFRGVNATIHYSGTAEEWALVSKHSTWGGAALEVVYNSSFNQSEETIDIYTIYFSATGNTSGIASLISDYTKSALYEITALIPYTSADLLYSNSNCRANLEQNDPTARPAIGSEAIDLIDYEVIYLGYPIWWGKAPKIIYTFLESYDLTGKTIIPFCTSGSSSISGSIADLQALEPNATWLSGRRFASNANATAIQNWIDSLNY